MQDVWAMIQEVIAVREICFERQSRMCYWCGRKLWRTPAPGEPRFEPSATLDHLTVPKVTHPDHCVVACKQCNNCRHNNPDWIPWHLAKDEYRKNFKAMRKLSLINGSKRAGPHFPQK